jgi:hypothetical protein
MEICMRLHILRVLLLMFLAVLVACNRPQATTPAPPIQDSPQPLIPALQSPAETGQEKAFLPVISNEGESSEGLQVDPHVEMLVNPTTVKVGDMLTVIGRPVELGLPYYYLIVRDEGVQQVEPVARVTYDNQLQAMTGSSQLLEFVSAQGKMDQVTFQLKAVAAGQTTITISVTGEVNVGTSGSSMWSGGGSGDVLVTVQP